MKATGSRRVGLARASLPLSTRPRQPALHPAARRAHAPATAQDHAGSEGDRDGHARLRAPRDGHSRVSGLAAAGKTSSWPPRSPPTRRSSFLWPTRSRLLRREPSRPELYQRSTRWITVRIGRAGRQCQGNYWCSAPGCQPRYRHRRASWYSGILLPRHRPGH